MKFLEIHARIKKIIKQIVMSCKKKYDLNKKNEDEVTQFNNDPRYIKDPARTWIKHKDPISGRDYYVNDSIRASVWDLPSPNPDFEPDYVSTPQPVSQMQQYKSVAPLHNTNPEEELSRISALLFEKEIESNPNNFIGKLSTFMANNKDFKISDTSFRSLLRLVAIQKS